MRNNPDDLSNQLLAKIEKLLKQEMKHTKAYHKITAGTADIVQGRNECASYLDFMIKKWKQELGL